MLPTDLTNQVSDMLGVDLNDGSYNKLLNILAFVYESGKIDGNNAGAEKVQGLFNQIYLTGLDAGIEKGKQQGLTEGYEKGMTEGKVIGDENGRKNGFEQGRIAGLNEAIQVIDQSKMVMDAIPQLYAQNPNFLSFRNR